MKRVINQNEGCSMTIVTISSGGWTIENMVSTRYQKPGVIEVYEVNNK